MKILLGNNTLSLLAGSETFTYTLAKEFKNLGHEVTAYSTDLGLIATKLEAEGIKCVSNFANNSEAKKFVLELEEEQSNDFDVIICNHYAVTKYLHSRFPKVPIIATVHGILHGNPETNEIWPEHPVTDFKVDQYVAVSEEVQDLLKSVYNIDSVIIRNFFDLERFKFLPTNDKPKTFFVNTNYWGKEDPIMAPIIEASEHYGAKIMAVGANFVGSYEIPDIIKDADVVFGVGRSVLEGVAMGRLGIVHGRWGTGGPITLDTINDIRKVNFSGRNANGRLATTKELIDMIDKNFNWKVFDKMSDYIKQEHDVKTAAKTYLNIAKSLIQNGSV